MDLSIPTSSYRLNSITAVFSSEMVFYFILPGKILEKSKILHSLFLSSFYTLVVQGAIQPFHLLGNVCLSLKYFLHARYMFLLNVYVYMSLSRFCVCLGLSMNTLMLILEPGELGTTSLPCTKWPVKYSKNKVGDPCRGWPEGSLFDSYDTKVYGRALLHPLDCSTLPLILTL